MPVLVFKSPDGQAQEMPLEGRVVIGRSAACAVRVEDGRVSRRHAEVSRQGDAFVVKDLGSRNGTRLNGRPVTSARLAYGDEIGVGNTCVLFVERALSERVGSTLAGYEVLAPLGHGGTGVVYLARQAALERVVALKLLYPRLATNRAFVEAFLRDAEAARALTHVNVVRIHEAGQAADECFCAMEYVDGPSVAELLRTQGVIRPRRALDITLQIASALDYAHRLGVLHRDIKPENILLTTDGTAKLADLGLSAAIQAVPRESETEGKPRIWATPAYLAPEIALGEPSDPRSDFYSLGATLFHMLTGALPFMGATVADVLNKHITAPLPELQSIGADIPRAINPLVEKLMAKRRERRHASAGELIADLTVLRELLRQVASSEETRFLTPLPPPKTAQDATSSTIARLVAKWLRR